MYAKWYRALQFVYNMEKEDKNISFQPEPCFGSMQQTVISRKEV